MREEKITLPLGAKKETNENQEVMLAPSQYRMIR